MSQRDGTVYNAAGRQRVKRKKYCRMDWVLGTITVLFLLFLSIKTAIDDHSVLALIGLSMIFHVLVRDPFAKQRKWYITLLIPELFFIVGKLINALMGTYYAHIYTTAIGCTQIIIMDMMTMYINSKTFSKRKRPYRNEDR